MDFTQPNIRANHQSGQIDILFTDHFDHCPPYHDSSETAEIIDSSQIISILEISKAVTKDDLKELDSKKAFRIYHRRILGELENVIGHLLNHYNFDWDEIRNHFLFAPILSEFSTFCIIRAYEENHKNSLLTWGDDLVGMAPEVRDDCDFMDYFTSALDGFMQYGMALGERDFIRTIYRKSFEIIRLNDPQMVIDLETHYLPILKLI